MKNIDKSVAIIGLSGVFPEADSIDKFFKNLKNGVDSVRNISIERLRDTAYNPFGHYMPMAFLENVSHFDHKFFGISKKEADMMAPEHRLVLQLSCAAIENAGYSLKDFRGSNTAVYLGGGELGHYKSLIQESDPTIMTGNMNALIAGRISYCLNLNGPALMIDTACSSSLVAIYEAYQKICSGEADQALAGGAYVICKFPEIEESKGDVGILSKDGRSKTFSAAANGTGGGEGGAILLLKRLDQALADNDHIHAVIKGGAINNDGSQSAGLTAPSPEAQTAVITKAWSNAEVLPESITYVEAHGTGTKLGDPIEFQALTDAFAQFSDKKKFCALSSVKTNIGHLNNAAGVAGIVKGIVSLQHELLLPSLHFDQPSPFIDFNNSAVYVNDSLKPWQKNEHPRRCGISSFGLSGTNAHLILEEAPKPAKPIINHANNPLFLKISAKSSKVLQEYISNIYHFLSNTDVNLEDALYTLNKGRTDYEYRYSVTALDKTSLLQKLKQCNQEAITEQLKPVKEDSSSPYIVLLLSNDQVEQEKIETLSSMYPPFKEAFEEILAKAEPNPSGAVVKFAFHYALYQIWQSFGMPVKKVIGAGVGRIGKQVIVDGLSLSKALATIQNQADDFDDSVNEEKLKKAVYGLCQSGNPVFLELGASALLSRKIREYLTSSGSNAEVTQLLDEKNSNILLEKVSYLYNLGLAVDWNLFYQGHAFNKVEAPTYPFEKVRCWPKIQQVKERRIHQETDVQDWFYNLQWNKDVSAEREVVNIKDGVFLVFMDQDGLGEMLVRSFELSGNRCIKVYQSNNYERVGQYQYKINTGLEGDYVKMEQHIARDFSKIQGAIHLGNYGPAKENNLESELNKGVYSQFLLVKTFHRYLGRNFHLLFLTSNGIRIGETNEEFSPSHNLSMALLKGIMAEYPLLKSHFIDVDFAVENQKGISEIVLKELARDKQIRFNAYRNGIRYIPELKTAKMPEHTPIDVVDGGAYLITGGASGIGLEIGKLLAKRSNIQLIILGRTLLPEKENWDAEELEQSVKEKIENLRALENLGAQVAYYNVDLSNEAAMQNIFALISAKISKLEAVIHSAGVPGNWEPVYRKQLIDFKATLAPKVQGTVLLDKLSKELAPDIFITFSSLNAIVAQKHSADYAVANAFEDAYMAAQNETTRYMSINWPGWYETGMSVKDKNKIIDINSGPLPPISNEEGLKAFQLATGFSQANVLVANIDLNLLHGNPYFIIESGLDFQQTEKIAESSEELSDEDTSPTEAKVMKIWKEVLRADKIMLEDDFFELGGHSLNGVQVINRIEKEFGLQLEIDDLYECLSLKMLAARIDKLLEEGAVSVYEDVMPVEKKPYYEVSHGQRRLWMLHQMKSGQTNYNMFNAFVFEDLNVAAFQSAFNTLVNRHESLRTTFVEVDGMPMQKINTFEESGIDLEVQDIRNLSETERELKQKQIVENVVQTIFDLKRGPLLQAKLIQVDNEKYVFTYVMHHIVSDGWSMQLLEQELLKLYNAFSQGIDNPLQALKIQYKDYAAWQNRLLAGDNLNRYEAYWLKKFEGEIPILNLPQDFARPAVKSYEGNVISVRLEDGLAEKLDKLSKVKNVSLFMTLLAILKTLFYRYTQQEEIVIGTVEAGRNHQSLENQIGCYFNTIALRTQFNGEAGFDALLADVKKTTLEAFEHKVYPFDLLVDKLQVARSMSHAPLFDVSMVLQNFDLGTQEIHNKQYIKVDNCEIEVTTSKLDLNLVFIATEKGMILQLEYSSELFTEASMRRLARHFEQMANAVLEDQQTPLCHLDYLNREEKDQLLTGFNDTLTKDISLQTMKDVFEETVARNPDSTALVFQNSSMTYLELNELANQFAHHLKDVLQVQNDEIVAMALDRSDRMIVAILGILKAGAAYLPIDPEYPEARISYILEDAAVRILVTDAADLFKFPYFEGEFIGLDVLLPILETSKENLPATITPQNLAYVIYTSGSTGKPKGVLIEHASNVNMAMDQIKRFGVNEHDNVLQFASPAFDASVYEIFMALYSGAGLVLLEKAIIEDTDSFTHYLKEKNVSVVTLPPAYLSTLDKGALDFVRVMITAGEAANIKDALHYSLSCKYFNAYGPTEAAVCVSTYEVSSEKDKDNTSVPIGLPINNTQIHLFDSHNQLVPIGVEGEIHIAGSGLARGYLNNKALTDDNFVMHPLTNTRVYKTGDIAKRLPGGEIEFLGRKDDQLKVRGYRIELGEIISLISNHQQVEDAFVLAKEQGNNDKILLAFIVPGKLLNNEEKLTESEDLKADIKKRCEQFLPAYMVPSGFVIVESIPLTTNGKVDKKRLLEQYEGVDKQKEHVPPSTPTEQQLHEIWTEILENDHIGIKDNFFELGGHSLKATQMISRIYKQMNVKLELGSIFSHATIESLALSMEEDTNKQVFESITPVDARDNYPLSYAQERLWILDQFEENKLAYNIPLSFRIKGPLNIPSFQKAFESIVDRYEILRTTFALVNEEPRQTVHKASELGIEMQVTDISGAEEIDKILQEFIEKESNAAFDLAEGPLLRAKLVQVEEQQFIFLLTMHHIITDGWSMELLTNEMGTLYNTYVDGTESKLPAMNIQYKDFAVWQKNQMSSDNAEQMRSQWLNQLAGDLPVLELPADKKRPKVKTYNGAMASLPLPAKKLQKLKEIARENNTSLFILLLTSVNALLHRYSGQDDIVLGTTMAGRNHKDLEGQVGFFVNTLPLRSTISDSDNLLSLLKEVNKNTLTAFQNQHYPFDKLLEDLDLERDPGRSPLFDVLVELVNLDFHQSKKVDLKDVELSAYDNGYAVSKYDYSFRFAEQDDALMLQLEYNCDIYTKATVERLLNHYKQFLDQLLENPKAPIKQIDYLLPEDKTELYRNFNIGVKYPSDGKTLIELFEQQVALQPEATALLFGEKQWTYAELNAFSNQLAHFLKDEKNIKPRDLVGVLMNRSEYLVAALLGIMKAGAAYVPIETNNPINRIQYIVKDTAVKCLIVENPDQFPVPFCDIVSSADMARLTNFSNTNLPHAIGENDLAYVIYTSGSTGQPKGVAVSHKGVVNRQSWMWDYYKMNINDVFLLKASYTFDVSVSEIFVPLSFGAKFALCPEEAIFDTSLMVETIAKYGVTTLHFVPSMLQTFLQGILPKEEGLTSLKRVLSGGEELRRETVRLYYELIDAPLYNLYGPTEASIDICHTKVEVEDEYISIGKPITNAKCYILDEHQQLVPQGVWGEIAIAGVPVAMGYLNRPELTHERFVTLAIAGEPERVYLTGDLGKYLPDGSLFCGGRKDKQVKLRGQRIELAEIEEYLLGYDGIEEVAVRLKKDAYEENCLVAYWVGVQNMDEISLKAYLLRHLPGQMIPNYFIHMEKLPLSNSGKLDDKQLPGVHEIANENGQTNYVAPSTELEVLLVEIMENILGQKPIGVHDNFFKIGGNSLKAARFFQRVNTEMPGALQMSDMFMYSNVESLAKHITELEDQEKPEEEEIKNFKKITI
jgi:amino acid adenylation domain-containing protein